MTATYDPNLSTDKDWVRLQIGDTDIASALLSDEEINGIIAAEPTVGTPACKFYAAATALSALYTTWSAGGRGISSIRVGSLDIVQGVSTSSSSSIEERIKELRRRGALASGRLKPLRAFGGYSRRVRSINRW